MSSFEKILLSFNLAKFDAVTLEFKIPISLTTSPISRSIFFLLPFNAKSVISSNEEESRIAFDNPEIAPPPTAIPPTYEN